MKVMILAAGRGERMRPLTERLPKALLEAGGKPLIVWQIERLARCGFDDIVINHAQFGDLIEQRLGGGAGLGVRISYSPEREPLETAGGIAQALPLLGPAPFLAVNADIYCEFDYTRLAGAGAPDGETTLAHLVLVDNPEHHPRGDFALGADGRIGAGTGRMLTFSGIGAYHPRLFGSIAPGSKARLASVLRDAIAHGRVGGEHFGGRWIDVGTPQRLERLRGLLERRAQT